MKEKWKDYYYKGLAVFLTVAMCILFFFAVFRLKELGHYVKVIAVHGTLQNLKATVNGFIIFQNLSDLTVCQGQSLLITFELRFNLSVFYNSAQKTAADNRITLFHVLLYDAFHLSGFRHCL